MNYECKDCNFKCQYLSNWNQHILTSKHKNNGKIIKKEIRNKYCDICNYKALTYIDARSHYLSKHGTIEEKKKEYPYYCKDCIFGTFGKSTFDLHCKSKKHQQCSLIK